MTDLLPALVTPQPPPTPRREYPVMAIARVGEGGIGGALRDMTEADLVALLRLLDVNAQSRILGSFIDPEHSSVARVIRAMSEWTAECRAGLVKEIGERWPAALMGAGARVAKLGEERDAAITRAETAEVELVAARIEVARSESLCHGYTEDISRAETERDEAIARAETAERERDEARATIERAENILYNTGATRGDIETRAKRAVETYNESIAESAELEEERDSLRAELDKVRGERELQMRVIEAATRWADGSNTIEEHYGAIDDLRAAVDSLSASEAGEGKVLSEPPEKAWRRGYSAGASAGLQFAMDLNAGKEAGAIHTPPYEPPRPEASP